jgi:hypothetical protein
MTKQVRAEYDEANQPDKAIFGKPTSELSKRLKNAKKIESTVRLNARVNFAWPLTAAYER